MNDFFQQYATTQSFFLLVTFALSVIFIYQTIKKQRIIGKMLHEALVQKQRTTAEQLRLSTRNLDYAEYNEELIKIFGQLFRASSYVNKLNLDFANAGSVLDVHHQPGQELEAIETLCSPNALSSYCQLHENPHGSSTSIAALHPEELKKWIANLQTANTEFLNIYNQDIVSVTNNFAAILKSTETPAE